MLKTEIAEMMDETQSIADHIDVYVEQLIIIAKLADKISFDRGEIVRLIKRLVVLSKRDVSLEFVLDI